MAFYEKRLLQLIDQSPVYRFATGSYNLLLLGNVLQCYRETFGTDLVLASDEQNGYYDNNTETSLKQFIRNLPRIRVARLPSEQVYVVCKAETARLLGLATDTTEEEILEEEEEELVVEEEEEDSKPRARSPKNNQAENHNSVVNIDSEDQNTNNKEMENLQVEPFMAVIDRVGVPADAEEEKSANDNNNLLHNNHQVEDASSAQASVVLPSVRALPVEERIQKFCEEKLIPSKVYQELEQRLHRFPEGLVASQINQLVPELLYFIREEGRSYLVPPTGSAATVLQACPDIEVKEENGTVHYKLRKEGSSNWQPPPPPAAAAAAAAVAIGLPSPPPAAPQIVRQEKLSASKKKSPPPPPAAAATSAATAVHSPPAPAPSETIALDKDSGAAMEFLRLLRVTFGKAPFPKTTKSLVALLGKHLKKQPNIFSDQWNRWAAAQCKLTKKRNRQVYCDIIRRFLIQYKKMGIVRTNNKDFKTFYWMKARAEGVINNKSLAVAAVAAAASQLARDAQRPVAAAGQADEETQMVTAARQWRNSRNESHPDAHPHSHVHPRQQPPGESAGPSPPSAAFRNSTWTTSSSAAIRLVETMEQLYKAKDELIPSKKRNVAVIDVDEDEEEQRDVWTDHHESVVAVDCEGVPNNIYLLQIGTGKATYLFDCVRLSPGVVCRVLQRLFTDKKIIKFFHDLHKDALALSTVGGLYESLKGTLDTQLAMEALTGEVHMGMNQMLEYLGQPLHATKKAFREKAHEHAAHGSLFRERPLPHDAITYAADDVDLVIKAKHALFNALQKEQPDGLWKSVQTASDLRAEAAVRNNGYRQLGFDVTNSYAIASLELLEVQRPSDLLVPTSLTISNDAAMLVALLPPDLAVDLQDVETQEDLSDIVLDKGRHPHVWANGVRKSIGSRDRLVTAEDLKSITEQLGGFGDDNRAGLERQLHRVSAVRNRKNDIIGLTLRVGRHVTGNAAMISDLLFHYPHRSILFLGEPGSG